MTLSIEVSVQNEEQKVSPWWDRAAAVAVGMGVALRLLAFLDRRPLWTDEALLALNVATRGFLDLLLPREYDQSAPIPFLWASRGVIGLLGVNEYALRLVPLLAGLALPVVLWRLARRVLGPPEGLLAAALAAISLLLVYYANEFRQYAVDALVTAVLVVETVRFLRQENTPRSWARLAVVGTAALLCSQPAVFVLAGTAAALVAHPETRSRPFRLAALFAVWAGVFGGIYLVSYAPAVGNPALQRFWEASFLRPGAADLATRLEIAGTRLFILPLFPPPLSVPAPAVILAFLAGLFGLAARRGWPLPLLLGTPFAAVGVAAMAGLYPPAERLLLFLAPLTFLVLSGLVTLARRLIPPAGRTMAQVGLCVAPAALNGWTLFVFLFAPAPQWNARSIIASLPRGGTVYVAARALPQWAFYTTDWRRPHRSRLAEMSEFMRQNAPEKIAARGEVVCEGDHLTLQDGERLEVIGVTTGIEFREPMGLTGSVPVPGWAENETRRIRAAGDSGAWVFSSHHHPIWVTALRSTLVQSGAHVVEERAQDRWHRATLVGAGSRDMAAAYRVVFRGPPATDSCPAARLHGNPRAPPSRRDTT